jgi:hypothetical protein
VLTVDQITQEPQTLESGMILSAPHPRHADYRSIGLPISGTTADLTCGACRPRSASTAPTS